MLDWKKNEYKKNFIRILLLGVVLRVLFMIFIGTTPQNEWEYGAIADNLVNGKGYSFYYFEGQDLSYIFKIDSHPSPSAYMPPGYVFILSGFKLISSGFVYSLLIFIFNLILFVVSLLYLFELTQNLFGSKVAIYSILIYSIIPEFIYTTYSIGTTQIYHLFLIMIFYYSLKNVKSRIFILPFIFGVAVLFRFELFLLLIFVIPIILYRKQYKKAILMIIIPIFFVSPWVIRNYHTFGEFIPFTTTSGLNLFRGNNDVQIGGWHNLNTLSAIHSFRGDTSNIELFLNDMYIKEGIKIISDDYGSEAINLGKKLIYFWIINPIEKDSLNPVYYVPWMILLSFAILGFIKSKDRPTILYLIITYHTILALVFIPLLRYQTMMKVIMIPVAAYGIKVFLKKK